MDRKDILLGFEVECVWPIFVGANLWKKKNNFQGKVIVSDVDSAIAKIKKCFSEHMSQSDLKLLSFKKDVTIASFSSNKPSSGRCLTFLRNKIKHDNQVYDLGFGLEIISEPILIEKAWILLMKIFEVMKKFECITNESTGLHLNISYVDQKKMLAVDYCKLCHSCKQEYWLKKFNREANRYCLRSDQFELTLNGVMEKALENYFLDNNSLESKSFDFNDYPEAVKGEDLFKVLNDVKFVEYLKDSARSKMYQSAGREGKSHCIVDRVGSDESRYFEFRLLGGCGYEKDVDLIEEALNHFVKCVDEGLIGAVDAKASK